MPRKVTKKGGKKYVKVPASGKAARARRKEERGR